MRQWFGLSLQSVSIPGVLLWFLGHQTLPRCLRFHRWTRGMAVHNLENMWSFLTGRVSLAECGSV